MTENQIGFLILGIIVLLFFWAAIRNNIKNGELTMYDKIRIVERKNKFETRYVIEMMEADFSGRFWFSNLRVDSYGEIYVKTNTEFTKELIFDTLEGAEAKVQKHFDSVTRRLAKESPTRTVVKTFSAPGFDDEFQHFLDLKEAIATGDKETETRLLHELEIKSA